MLLLIPWCMYAYAVCSQSPTSPCFATLYATLERQPFTSRRFGSSSYLIILKGVETGEYGITVDALGSLNVSTFGVDE